MITRKLIGVSRSDASVAPAGVGGGLEAWITCWGGGVKDIWFTDKEHESEPEHTIIV